MTVGAGIFALGFPVLSYSNRICPPAAWLMSALNKQSTNKDKAGCGPGPYSVS